MTDQGDITPHESLEELRDYKYNLVKMKAHYLNTIRRLNTEITEIDMAIVEVYNDQKKERS